MNEEQKMSHYETAINVLKMESDSIDRVASLLKEDQIEQMVSIFKLLRNNGGNLVFLGVGKSGHIAQKLAATFSSLGLKSFFLHPVEALHGDLGRLTADDALIILSKSGNTEEVLKLLPYIDVPRSMRVGLLGKPDSAIGAVCDLIFDCSVKKEACLNNQAPTTSSTVALAMGDALAVVYEHMVGLSKEDFAKYHPGGLLGKIIRLKVRDLMWEKEKTPVASLNSTLQEIILAMTQKPIGGCAILDQEQKLLGIVVEGDIRRTFTKPNMGLQSSAQEIMNASPVTILANDKALEALSLMENRSSPISLLPVVDDEKKFIGFIRLHDLLNEGLR